jgi:hypothetical protein
MATSGYHIFYNNAILMFKLMCGTIKRYEGYGSHWKIQHLEQFSTKLLNQVVSITVILFVMNFSNNVIHYNYELN